MFLTCEEKQQMVSARYDIDALVDILEITPAQLLAAFPDELEDNWYKFEDIEDDIEEQRGYTGE